jgi:hypothetical protein
MKKILAYVQQSEGQRDAEIGEKLSVYVVQILSEK